METWSANPFLEINRRGENETIVYEPIFDNYYQLPRREFRALIGAARTGGVSGPDPADGAFRQLADEHLVIPLQRPQPDLSTALLQQVRSVSRRLGLKFRARLAAALARPGSSQTRLEAVRRLPFGEALLYLAEQKIALGGRERPRFNLLNTYIPLIDPVGLFERYLSVFERMWNARAPRILLVLNLLAIPLYALHFRALFASFASFYAQRTLAGWLLSLCLLAVQGALHELGHGLALARYGQSPREAGIVLMFLLPGVYIDTSAAYLLPDKRQRIAVSFAGIVVNDLFVLLGLLAYIVMPVGLARDLIGTFVIGNTLLSVTAYAPFLKSDTYFMLSDYIEVPNLRQTSFQVLRGLLTGKRVDRAWKHLLAAYAALSVVFYVIVGVTSFLSLFFLVGWLMNVLLGAIRSLAR